MQGAGGRLGRFAWRLDSGQGCVLVWRYVSTVSGGSSAAKAPCFVEFELSPSQAEDRWQQWHATRWLAPGKLLNGGSDTITASLLPFWVFECRVRPSFSASVGRRRKGSGRSEKSEAGGVDLEWAEVPLQQLPDKRLSADDPNAQVYASYQQRRDLAAGMKLPDLEQRVQPVFGQGHERRRREGPEALLLELRSRCGDGGREPVVVHEADMRQGIAWELVKRQITLQAMAEAEAVLRREQGADAVKDVKVALQVLERRCRQVWLPAYWLRYRFGTRYRPGTSEVVPHEFEAMVPGVSSGCVVAERHLCPRKAELASATVMASGTGLAAACSSMLAGVEPAAFLTMDSLFWTFITCCAAGVAARHSTGMARAAQSVRMQQLEEHPHWAFHSRGEEGEAAAGSEGDDFLQADAEWHRWEEADKWHWDHEKRRAWANALFQMQHRRRLDRRSHQEKLQRERQRQDNMAAREARRQARYGDSGWAEGGRARSHSAGHSGRRSPDAAGARWVRDPLGYYKLLGVQPRPLQPDDDTAFLADVKAAFRRAAKRWHPDMQHHDARDAPSARQRFQRLKTAYEVLSDPEKRRMYDRGEDVN